MDTTFYPDLETRYGTQTLQLAMLIASDAGTSADRMNAVAASCAKIEAERLAIRGGNVDLPGCCEAVLDRDGASCTFGCNHRVDSDTGICPSCRDHSANVFDCDVCGRHWEDWGSGWEIAQ